MSRVSQVTATVARALGWPDAVVSRLREMGNGYSAVKSQCPRDIPSDEVIEELIGSLSATWQRPVAVAAVDGY